MDRFYDRLHALKLQKEQQLASLKETYANREQQDEAAVDTISHGKYLNNSCIFILLIRWMVDRRGDNPGSVERGRGTVSSRRIVEEASARLQYSNRFANQMSSLH